MQITSYMRKCVRLERRFKRLLKSAIESGKIDRDTAIQILYAGKTVFATKDLISLGLMIKLCDYIEKKRSII